MEKKKNIKKMKKGKMRMLWDLGRAKMLNGHRDIFAIKE